MTGWHFEKYDGYSDINASTAAESFLEHAVPDLATGVVREGIQNSLDARRKDLTTEEPVRVRLTFARASGAISTYESESPSRHCAQMLSQSVTSSAATTGNPIALPHGNA